MSNAPKTKDNLRTPGTLTIQDPPDYDHIVIYKLDPIDSGVAANLWCYALRKAKEDAQIIGHYHVFSEAFAAAQSQFGNLPCYVPQHKFDSANYESGWDT